MSGNRHSQSMCLFLKKELSVLGERMVRPSEFVLGILDGSGCCQILLGTRAIRDVVYI